MTFKEEVQWTEDNFVFELFLFSLSLSHSLVLVLCVCVCVFISLCLWIELLTVIKRLIEELIMKLKLKNISHYLFYL